MKSHGLFLLGRSSALALTMAMMAAPAFAQAATPDTPPSQPASSTNPVAAPTTPAASAQSAAASNAETGEIIVTGSRLGHTGYTTPTPVNVVGSERMANLGISNVGDALNQLPSFRATTSPTANLFRVQQSIAARTMDLRGLGPTRTLTLVDGRRFPASSDLGTIDLNSVPSLLVDRTEVVTGGASAAYGADAVAGVVNVILDGKLQGVKTDFSAGTSQRGDGEELYAAFAAGTGFAGDRGHTVFSAEYDKNYGVGDIETRSWGRRHVNFVSNPGWPGNGQPSLIVAPNSVFVITKGGMIPSGPLKGTQFDANGNPQPFQFGNPVGGTLMVGGDPSIDGAYIIDNVPLETPNSHFSAYSHSSFDFSDALTAVFELSYSDVKGGPADGADPYDFSVPIKLDNAYLPESIRQQAIAAGVTSVPVSRLSSEFGPGNRGYSENKTYRAMLALNGKLFGDWKWDGYYQYGWNKGHVTILDNRIAAHWNNAIDAVRAPSGQIVCRSTLTNPTDGCIPIDFFGINPGNLAASSYVLGTASQTRKYVSQTGALNAHGDLFNTWAGPVSVAVGGEWRRETYRGTVDAISAAAGFTQNYAVGLPTGGQSVTEEYIEASIPLLKDSPIGKSFDVDGAFRHTKYSVTGSANTWKVGGVYRLNDQLMLRVTRSHDIRAPAPAELSPLQSVSALPLNDPILKSTYFMNVITSGNPNLKLEKANTFTAGGVIQPKFVRNFSLSLDYYNIKIKDAIDVLAAASTINLCAAGNASVCQFVNRDPVTNQIISVTSAYQNLSSLRTAGWELSADYLIHMEDISPKIAGRTNISINGNYVNHLTTINATGVKQELSNWTGNPGSIQTLLGVPRWRVNGVINYDNQLWGLTAEMRYVPKGILDPTKIGPEQDGYSQTLPNSANLNYVDGAFYLDMTARVNIGFFHGGKAQLYFTVNNVLDKNPPNTLRLFGNPLLFDPIGRYFKAGIRTRF
jgi:outer membrane receptor protein involved in Fe transport